MASYSAQFTEVSRPSEGVLLLSLSRRPVSASPVGHRHSWSLTPHRCLSRAVLARGAPYLTAAFHRRDAHGAQLQSLATTASADPDVRAVVLASSNDKLFTAGLDLQDAAKTFVERPEGADVARRGFHLRQHILDFQDAISSLEKCMKPVIIAMHGLA
jgi:hypothetical protein